jgi:hypothetical protein
MTVGTNDGMAENLSFHNARYALATVANDRLNKSYKELVETKHLYQSVTVDFESPFKELMAKVLADTHKQAFRDYAETAASVALFLSETPQFNTDPGGGVKYPSLGLTLGNVKLFCSACKAVETFSPASYSDAMKDGRGTNPRIASYAAHFQVFAISYQCENCKQVPVVFLIRRVGWKLTIQGRSPIETVVTPPFIPKIETWLFSGAVVAHQTGNTLAGLFYLRSFIEQFARRQTGIAGKKTGDDILDAYQALIPEKNRDHMPSLRSWYEQLSVPIHTAKSDSAMFEEAKNAIIEHFDFRRVFKIADTAPPLNP